MGNKKKLTHELNFPEDVSYSSDHAWVKNEGDRIRIGITDYAQEQLGEIVFIELPSVGDSFKKGEIFGQAESVKSVSSLYIPVTGEVLSINQDIEGDPELVNQSPYREGWLVTVKAANLAELAGLLTPQEYIRLIEE